MISNHIKKGLWLWIGLCLALWVCSKQSQFRQHADQIAHIVTIGFLSVTASLVIALLIVRSREIARAGKRLTELHRRVQSGETIEIHGGSGLPRLIVMLAFAGIIVSPFILDTSWAFYEWHFVVLIPALGIPTAFELLTVIPLLRRPILRISRETLESPVFGKLSWRDIDGIDLSQIELQDITIHHRLHLLVLRLPEITQQLHPATQLKQRLRSLFRPSTELHLRLLRASEMPKVILALCQRTCSEYTNNPTLWKKGMSAQQLVEKRRAALEQRERDIEEIKASVQSVAQPQSRPSPRIEAADFMKELRQKREELRGMKDAMWETQVTPPDLATHWVTWLATAVVAAGLAWIGYLFFKSTP